MSKIEGFKNAVLDYLKIEEDSYYYKEYLSALDYSDEQSQSELAEYFFNKGIEYARKQMQHID